MSWIEDILRIPLEFAEQMFEKDYIIPIIVGLAILMIFLLVRGAGT